MYGRESDSEDSQEEGGEGLDNPAFYPSKGAGSGGPPGSESWCWQGLRFWGRPRPFWTAPGGPPLAFSGRHPSFALPGPSAVCYGPHSAYWPILAANKRPPGRFFLGPLEPRQVLRNTSVMKLWQCMLIVGPEFWTVHTHTACIEQEEPE